MQSNLSWTIRRSTKNRAAGDAQFYALALAWFSLHSLASGG
jgi:hypothetical protein